MSTRKARLLATAIRALASLALAAPVLAAEPRLPFPQHVEYAPGSLRPSLRTQEQQDADVLAAYQSWKSRYLMQMGTELDGHPRYRVKTSTAASADTVSEGQGYGMLIAVHLAGADPAAQTIFDGLWELSLDHPSSIDPRLMDWHVKADESPACCRTSWCRCPSRTTGRGRRRQVSSKAPTTATTTTTPGASRGAWARTP